jgi:hypothetical protein
MNSLIVHLENTLGKIDVAWKDADGTVWPFYVLRFTGGPIANSVTYTTLGLSEIPLRSRSSDKPIRHELLIMARPSFGDLSFPAILRQVGEESISEGYAYLRGDVIGPRGTLIPDSKMEALYVSLPVYLPESFARLDSHDGNTRVFAWLVPITGSEVEYVKILGWQAFENELASTDPDLLDLHRPSVGTRKRNAERGHC